MSERLDPVTLSVLSSALSGIAEEMGAVLIRAAYSSNIKERRDCSAALFDADGRMVAQAEHIPVHLGAMPEAVAAVMEREPRPGDVFAVNDPFSGGTHLPDITLVSPVAEGEPLADPLALILANVRTPEVRRGDLRAQLAAHRLGTLRVAEICARHGRDRVAAAMNELFSYSERGVRAALARLPDGRFEATDVLEAADGDLAVHVTVTLAGDEIEFDFAGTAAQHPGNLNCPMSVTRSACYFVVRCLTDPDLPASGGAFAPVAVAAPEGSLVNARPPAAVAAGNVETSCRIVDACFLALSEAIPVPAQGQGTMNNVTLGNERFTYYETIGGGQGACPDADGPSPSGQAP